jgi:hypothetical protein
MFELTDAEALAVTQALDAWLPELRYDLARIKRERDRRELVALEDTLSRLRSRLREPPTGEEQEAVEALPAP